MFSFVLSFTFIALAVTSPVNYEPNKCVISLDYKNAADVKDNQPLIFKDAKESEFLYPTTDDRLLKISSGKSIYLACPGKDNYLNITGRPPAAEAVCMRNKMFIVNEANYNFTSLVCKSLPRHEAKRAGRCLRNGTLIKIGFELEDHFQPTLEICRDDETYVTYYSKAHITKRIANYQSGFPRPYWLAGKFYSKIKVQDVYSRDSQLTTIAKIVKSESLAKKYLKDGSYMSRGHLTAKADFVYGAQQMTTFWYLNAAPQWQTFNAGNWNNLEMNVRNFATDRKVDLIVYTGVHGQMNLRDINGRYQPVHLHVNGTTKILPVPLFYWKVIYDPLSKNGTAFVGVNDPHRQRITSSLYLCADISKKIKWLTWSPTDIQAGVSYACKVSDLRKSVPTLPSLDVKNLLL